MGCRVLLQLPIGRRWVFGLTTRLPVVHLRLLLLLQMYTQRLRKSPSISAVRWTLPLDAKLLRDQPFLQMIGQSLL